MFIVRRIKLHFLGALVIVGLLAACDLHRSGVRASSFGIQTDGGSELTAILFDCRSERRTATPRIEVHTLAPDSPNQVADVLALYTSEGPRPLPSRFSLLSAPVGFESSLASPVDLGAIEPSYFVETFIQNWGNAVFRWSDALARGSEVFFDGRWFPTADDAGRAACGR